MPVSLGRRLRRLGIPLKEQRAADWKADLTNPFVATEARDLITAAKNNRVIRFDTQKTPSRLHRRSKSRIKRGREEVKGYPTSGSKKK